MGAMALPPGFRFHPTDEELLVYYLKRKIEGLKMELEIIPAIELYKFDPWQLPDKSFLPKRDLEWFFFCPRDKKYPNGSRTNRATRSGYWKATGKDRQVVCHGSVTGLKKTLVFYLGRAPLGDRTDWVMHEYRIYDDSTQGPSIVESPFALCRIVKRSDQGQKIGDHPAETKKKRSQSYIMSDANSVRISSQEQTRPIPQKAFPETYFVERISDTSSKDSNLYTSEVNDFLKDQRMEKQLQIWQSTDPVGVPILLPEENCILENERNELDLGAYASQIEVTTPYCGEIDCSQMLEYDSFLYQNFELPEQHMNVASHYMGFDQRNAIITPSICREASLDGNFGETGSLWLVEDSSVAVV